MKSNMFHFENIKSLFFLLLRERRNVNLEIHPLQHFCYREQICQSIFICSKISHNMNVSHKTVSIDKTHFLLISGTK